MREREREREREMQSRATRVTVLRTVALMILKLVNPLQSLEDRIAIHMNRLLCAPLVFSSSSLKQWYNVKLEQRKIKCLIVIALLSTLNGSIKGYKNTL